MADFSELGLSPRVLSTLEKVGFEEPTEIQMLAIPLFMEDRKDIIAQAQTGTGKTAAFALPLIEKLRHRSKVQALILAPTRELVLQIRNEIDSLKGENDLRVLPIYGGSPYPAQLKGLKEGPSIVVGTPGRILDHLRKGSLRLDGIEYLILDEADEMLNMGFIEDVETILAQTPSKKRMLLFSATIPDRIKRLSQKYMGPSAHIRSEKQITTHLTDQGFFEVKKGLRDEVLSRVIDTESDFYGIVFCKTRLDVDALTSRLKDRGYKAEGLHGEIPQQVRERILARFRDRSVSVLIATDVAARGIDVKDLTHVINYSMPHNPEAYVHRIGRTGRAGSKGIAITFVSPSEKRKLDSIIRFTGTGIRKMKVPGKKEIMDKQLRSIREKIRSNKADPEYLELATELLKEDNPEEIISQLLFVAYGSRPKEEIPFESTPQKKVYPPKPDRDRGHYGKRSNYNKSRSNDRGSQYQFKGKKDRRSGLKKKHR
jgi:ATP-dependent RNA helicase DeaD